jgi:hypothetical protein
MPPALARPGDPLIVDARTRSRASSMSAKISVKAEGSRRLPSVSTPTMISQLIKKAATVWTVSALLTPHQP